MTRKTIATSIGTLILGFVIGIGLMQIDGFYSSVKTALGSEVTQNNVGAINLSNIEGMDLETALMEIQTERTKLLEQQLNDQIIAVQERNNQLAKLNELLNQVYKVNASFSPSDPADTPISGSASENIAEIENSLTQLGIESDLKVREDVEQATTKVKAMIDSMSNSQQMDMLRLQSMSNKRNEAFEVMTNFIKKMQDSRASIIRNM